MRLPPDPERMNNQRADWARNVVEFFEQYGEKPHPNASEDQRCRMAGQNLSDMIADFGHYCNRIGLSMQDVIQAATVHYSEETNNEGEQFKPQSISFD
jgi:hypothetical protein